MNSTSAKNKVGACNVAPLQPEDEEVTVSSTVCSVQRRGLSEVLLDEYDQIFFFVQEAWHSYSESVQ